MNKAIETLQERGFFNQCTDLEALSAKMDEGPVTFYVGADPTGPSLHIDGERHCGRFCVQRFLERRTHDRFCQV